MNDCAIRRILPDVQIFATAGPVRLAEGSDTAAQPRSERVRYAARPQAPQSPEMQLCTNRFAGLKELASAAVVNEASERRDVVQDPERAAVGSCYQIRALGLQIVDRHDRQAASHAHPALSIGQAAIYAGLGANEQQ